MIRALSGVSYGFKLARRVSTDAMKAVPSVGKT